MKIIQQRDSNPRVFSNNTISVNKVLCVYYFFSGSFRSGNRGICTRWVVQLVYCGAAARHQTCIRSTYVHIYMYDMYLVMSCGTETN